MEVGDALGIDRPRDRGTPSPRLTDCHRRATPWHYSDKPNN
jgi:hypothetical protein